MPGRSNVVKFKKRKNVNLGVVIFLIIAVYMILNVVLFLTKSQISIYEVTEENLARDTVVTGVIIRDETLVTTSKAGYINYYQREGARVARNSTIYSIDESKVIYEKLSDNGDAVSLSKNDVNEIKRDISKFKKSYSDSSFSKVSSFKDDITSSVQELIDMNLLDNMQEIISTTGINSSFEVNKTDRSGIISYKIDNLLGITADSVTMETFNIENYTKTNLRSSDITEANGPVYKLVTSDSWSIIAPISAEIFQEIKEKESMKFTILENDLTLTAPMTLTQNGSEYFIKLDLDQYMIAYLGERFLEIELNISAESGYKIPLSAITEKEFFMIPTTFFTYGGDSDEKGIVVESYDNKTGEVVYTFTPATIYFEDETYSYVDIDLVNHGTSIYNSETNERFQVSMVGKLEGVLNVNKGYAVFRRIERISENDAYCIVKKGTSNGLSLYDHIALDATDAIESAIIY